MPGPTDDQLLRMLREVQEQEDAADDIIGAAAAAAADARGHEDEAPEQICPNCGEPAEALAECSVCHEPGCLPRDDWMPGERDPCLTACARCGRLLHVGCAAEDEAGNPRCPTCSF